MPLFGFATLAPRASRRHLLATLAASLTLAAAPLAAAQFLELDVPYVPTPDDTVAKMLEMTNVGPKDILFDLGSGDGRIAIAAVRDRKAAHATGIEIDPRLVKKAQDNAKQAGVEDKVVFKEQDLFDTDFSKATVLTMYLLPDVNIKLRPRILDEMAPGSRVVSHAFTMGDWDSDRYESVDGRSLYLWIVPAKVAGTWHIEHPAGPITLQLSQHYQKLTGTARRHDAVLDVTQAKLTGNQIELVFDDGGKPLRFIGLVRGDTMAAMGLDGAEQGWQATRRAP